MKIITCFTHLSKLLFVLSLLLATGGLAHAHTGAGSTHGFSHGFGHPLGGLDHLLAMLAVGLWAAQIGGRATWAVPTSFVSVMTIGGILGISSVELPGVELGIVGSVLVLGVLIAAAIRLPLGVSMAIVGMFALCHGHAHGTEMPEDASGLTYAIGFILATILLHTAGIGLGIAIQKASRPVFVRWAGGAMALAGIYLFIA